ncbi:maleylpyruvate isomerase family mycothiol-dependent enzyme [Micromonospora sp. WMMC241]|uniref:maleylpyruvate isomerase family mycothiol-dependent enzyme n=1 Tax=Micromonospora sp. WMMC241 TaxID=3015159 RepID=UPI0022B75233|nr:maleylpyruvate isomerase family mycothiol-dependent enzyme [Micromonospora sp. WMMC241]MCZ7437376.1 maleylpyruvate isomerase family mycothiol-dependent enzyme [Micromonospora sp. WMMC241]
MDADLLPMIAAERRRTADLIDSLTPAQLDTPSLCGAWTVREVAGHLVSPLVESPWRLLPLLVGAGFRPHVANARLARLVSRRPPGELAAALRTHAEHRFRPPVVGWYGQLTDLQVHGQDIRRPLGLPADLDPDRLRISLDFLTGGRAIGFVDRRRVAGLRFEATDLGWSAGDGPAVHGPGEALLLALTGRRVALADLTGDGVARLAAR